MFEQSLYETEPVATPQSAGDLFHDYEIKTWEFTPRLYKILGVAAFGNVLALLIFAQTSVLTMKGCDSPLVGRVCDVLDTVYVGSLLFGTDREYVDAAYDKTDLGESDITFVDVSGETPPLSYPEGYFQVANPNEYQAMLDQANNPGFSTTGIPGFPPGIPMTMPSTGNSLFDTKPKIPKSNPSVIEGDLPTSIDDRTGLPYTPIRRPKGPNMGRVIVPKTPPVTPKPTPDANANVAVTKVDPEKKVDPIAPATTFDINKRPFVDLANNVNDLLAKKEVNLDTKFLVNAKGKLTKEGKLDPKTFKYLQTLSTDQNMIKVVQQGIEAINDSGYLQYLNALTGKDFNIALQQDDANITAIVQSDMDDANHANTIKSGLNGIISIAKMKKSGENADQNDKDDLVLLENAKVETNGKKIIITFMVPKDIAQKMIQRKLAEQAKEPRQPNGNATVKPADNAGK